MVDTQCMHMDNKVASQDAEWVEVRPKRIPKPLKVTGKPSGKVVAEKNILNQMSRDVKINFSTISLLIVPQRKEGLFLWANEKVI